LTEKAATGSQIPPRLFFLGLALVPDLCHTPGIARIYQRQGKKLAELAMADIEVKLERREIGGDLRPSGPRPLESRREAVDF